MKIPHRRELRQIAINNSLDIDFKNFKRIYTNFTERPYSLLVNDTSLPSNNDLRLR